jgi:hypothetical protein
VSVARNGSALILACSLLCCRARPQETRIVVVTATPVPPTPVVLIEPTVTPVIETAEFSFPLTEPTEARPAPTAPAAVAELPRTFIGKRDPLPTPSSLREQMEQCVTLTASDDYGAPLEGAARVRVKAKNACNVAFAWDDIWVEVNARPLSGTGVLGRTVGRLFSEIRPYGEAEGVMLVPGVSSGPFKRLEVTFWWAAGGGRKPGE